MANHAIKHKIVVHTTVTNESPLLIATGKGDDTDFELVRDIDGKPYIPAAGFAGMIRQSLVQLAQDFSDAEKQQLDKFIGTDKRNQDNPIQSHLLIDNLYLQASSPCNIVVRDGVKITPATGMAEDGSKYDYELLEPGAQFDLRMELTLREGFDKTLFLQFLSFIIRKGEEGEYQQGAFKSNGFGKLKWKDTAVFMFDFPNSADAWFAYLKGTKPEDQHPFQGITPLKTKEDNLCNISGTFEIRNALIIGSQKAGVEGGVDKQHLTDSEGKPLLTAKSLRGPLRHRALRILKTLGKENAEDFVNQLFGYVNEDNKTAQKGRFLTEETKIKGANSTQIQPRVKIDRFTGGAVETALMQTQPLWHDKETLTLNFQIQNCSDKEAGLMLLVMKDLFHGDLAIGGEKAIGRGTLTGKTLSVKGMVGDKEIPEITFNVTGISDTQHIETVNKWVKALQN